MKTELAKLVDGVRRRLDELGEEELWEGPKTEALRLLGEIREGLPNILGNDEPAKEG